MTTAEGPPTPNTMPNPGLTPGEQMRQQIMTAEPGVVYEAIEEHQRQLVEEAGANPDTIKKFNLGHQVTLTAPDRSLLKANFAKNLADQWVNDNRNRQNQGAPSQGFPDYINGLITEGNESEAVLITEDWIKRSYNESVGNVIRSRQAPEQMAETAPTQPSTQPEVARVDPRIEAAQQQQAANQARASVEQARGLEIFDTVARIAKNKTQLYTDATGGYQHVGDGPKAQASIAIMPQQIAEKLPKSSDWRQKLNEATVFTEVMTNEKREVSHSRVEKGRFGRNITTTYTSSEVVPNSERPVLIRNEQTGQDEPVIRFRYGFKYSPEAIGAEGNELPRYQEFAGGRSGQNIFVGLDLPKSVATELQARVADDPTSVRTLVEKLFLENNNGNVTEEFWRVGGTSKHPIRPPYEALPPDWSMMIVKGQEFASTNRSIISSHTVERVPTVR